jgi:hypothetical protein
MKRAAEYEILRGVSPTSRKPCAVQPSQRPIRVAFVVDEARFIESGGLYEHHKSIFLEDKMHDWHVSSEGQFYYYGHAMGVDESGDILVVFKEEEVKPPTA